MTDRTIHNQVKLPLRVAFGIVMQGIRTRLGRSVVTMTGVVLGIAFLASILTTQVVVEGVRRQRQLRQEAGRMLSFLTAETGPLDGKAVALVPVGPLSPAEQAFLRRLAGEGPGELRWVAGGSVQSSPPARVEVTEPTGDPALQDVRAIVIVGQAAGPGPPAEVPPLPAGRQTVLAYTSEQAGAALAGREGTSLTRELRPEELARRRAERQWQRFRNGWIIAISLLVTVIGVSNAMLMSVTERFREIGTMKCLGALSAFIRQIFLIESSLMGLVGSVLGALVGGAFSIAGYSLSYGWGPVLGSMDWLDLAGRLALCVLAGVVLAVLAAIYPARFASRMVPAHALRTNI
jgi:ABC-type antimicrobial peptide transport system permease subunit